MTKNLRAAAWLVLIAILFVTLSPADLRPVIDRSPDLERFGAFALAGGLFTLAYPQRRPMILGLITGSAGLFEISQLMVPERHAAADDFLIKAIGGVLGIAVALGLNRMIRRGIRYGP